MCITGTRWDLLLPYEVQIEPGDSPSRILLALVIDVKHRYRILAIVELISGFDSSCIDVQAILKDKKIPTVRCLGGFQFSLLYCYRLPSNEVADYCPSASS
jgi:hypothetical protein